MRVVVAYVKTVTVEAASQQQELDENHEVVQAAARLAGVSAHAVMSHVRCLRLLQSEMKTHASGFVGVSLGRVMLPGMDRSVLRRDGWRAATIGADSIVPELPPGQIHVTDGGMSERLEREAMTQEEIDRDVVTLRQFWGMLDDDVEVVAQIAQTAQPDNALDAISDANLPPSDVDPMSGSS